MARWLCLISALMMLMSCSETEDNVLEGVSSSPIPTPVLVYNYWVFVGDGAEYHCRDWSVAKSRPKTLKLYECKGYNGKVLSIEGCEKLTIIPLDSDEIECTPTPP